MPLNKEKATAIAHTVSTAGWSLLKEHMNEVLRRVQDDVFDMADPVEAEKMRIGVRLMRNWRDTFFGSAEALSNFSDEAYEDFSNLTFEVTEKI